MNTITFQKTISELVTSSRDYEDFSYNSLMAITELLRVQRSSLWHLDKLGSKIECQILLDKDQGILLEVAELREYDFPNYFQALKSGNAIVANNARTDSQTSEFSEIYLIPNGITSMLDIPIFNKEELVGIICCEHVGEVREWKDSEISFVFEVAKLLEQL